VSGFGVALLLAVVLLVAACTGAAAADRLFLAVGRFASVGRATVPLAAAGFSLLVSSALALLGSAAIPQFHDEFSYLLAADTFAHGRLTNPPHALAVHLQTFHVLQEPTYSSKYPPGEGLLLASGRLMIRSPLAAATLGAALGAAAAAAAVAWALMAILPRPWALLGALLVVLEPIIVYWSRSYWGGQVAMAGGALLLGAVLRLRVRGGAVDGLLAGSGIALLLLSRPFEGLVFCILATAWAVRPLWQSRRPWAILGAAAIPLLGASVLIAMDNLRVTGRVGLLPYVLHESQYAQAPPFIFMPPRPPKTYLYQDFRDYYDWQENHYMQQRSALGLLKGIWQKAGDFANAYLDPPWIALPLIGLLIPARMLCRRGRIGRRCPARQARRQTAGGLAVICLCFLAAQTASVWYYPHYTAPLVAAMAGLTLLGARRLGRLRAGNFRLGRSMLVFILAMLVLRFVDACRGHALVSSGWGGSRVQLIDQLRLLGGRSVVIVRRQPGYDFQFEWVYNDADIDASPVVFVHDAGELGDPDNLDVRRYYADRRIWLMDVGAANVKTRIKPLPPLLGAAHPALDGSR